ncbi:MAG TPA: DUF222 domain-containing protein [Solirubrobacterales bacterium]|nr:DUF222 domain-containing protein [Solirubrobacterales bacterium]
MFVEGGTKPEVKLEAEQSALLDAPTDWIEREIGELAAHIAAATYRWLELVAEFDRRSAHEAWGFRSCGAWVAWRCSIDPRSAREHVRVARALEELPLVREKFSHGELSYSKVRAITRIATSEIEHELVEMARFATAAQLDRLVRGYRRAVSLESAEVAHRDRFLSCEWDEDGSLCIRGRLAPEDGALFLKTVEAGRGAIREREEADSAVSQGGSAEPTPTKRVNDADALMEVAERSLAGGASPRPAGERHQVIVHADAEALAGDGGRAGCSLDDGPAICAETARRMACDASLVSILHGPKGALDIGRKTRAIPPSMRRALDVRDDGRCRFPGCENRRWVDAHHIVHWARGGDTKLDNLVLLCGHHHRLVHEGGFSVVPKRDGSLVFRRPNGEVVPEVPLPTRGRSTELRSRNREGGLDIVPGASMSLGRGDPFDRELAVAGLLALNSP